MSKIGDKQSKMFYNLNDYNNKQICQQQKPKWHINKKRQAKLKDKIQENDQRTIPQWRDVHGFISNNIRLVKILRMLYLI